MSDIVLMALGLTMAVGITGYLQRIFATTHPEFRSFLTFVRWVLVIGFGLGLVFTLFSAVLDLLGA